MVSYYPYVVCSVKNDKQQIIHKVFIFQKNLLLAFLNISTADPHTLLAPLKPALKGGGVGFFGDGSCYPIQAFLTPSAAMVLPASASFTFGNKKKSAGARSGE
jgi:hypothetical protein